MSCCGNRRPEIRVSGRTRGIAAKFADSLPALNLFTIEGWQTPPSSSAPPIPACAELWAAGAAALDRLAPGRHPLYKRAQTVHALKMISAKALFRSAAIQSLTGWERLRTGVSYFPLDDTFQQNPFPTYARLRRKDPVHWSPTVNAWVLSLYEDVDATLRDFKRFANDSRKTRGEPPPGEAPEAPSMLSLDPPDHTRMRALVSKAFTPRAVRAMEPRIEELVHELLGELPEGEPVDIIAGLAYPLPVIVIAEMIGVLPEDRDRFKRWSDVMARTLEPTITREELSEAMDARDELIEYFRAVIEERRKNPREDLVSSLVAAEEEGDRLSEAEMYSTLILLLVAGNETTTNLIGNGLLALLRHPDQYQLLRDDASLTESAVEEMLRYDSPVQTDARFVLEDVELRGKVLRRGDQVLQLIGSANRDPRVFPEPRKLDITREENNHLAFGRGIHHCLGAPLARMEGRIAFRALADRYPRIALADPAPRFRDQVVLRGLEALPVVLHRA